MKTKRILILSVLLSQAAPVQGMEPDNEKSHGIPHRVVQPRDIESVAVTLNDEICRSIRTGIKLYVKEAIKNHRSHAGTLRTDLSCLFGELDLLRTSVRKNPRALVDFRNQNFFHFSVRNKIEEITTLNKNNSLCKTGDWIKAIDSIITPIYLFGDSPTFRFQGGTLELIKGGAILGISDISDAINKQVEVGNAVDSVIADIEHILLIDDSMRRHGMNLTLKAKHWRVIGEQTIDISGTPGAEHNSPKAENGIHVSNVEADDRRNGSHGMEGYPGGSGGHFKGHVKTFENLENLTINTSGGKGGKGQGGGDGANGEDGRDGNLELVKAKNNEILKERKELKENNVEGWLKYFLTFNVKYEETYESSGTPGEPGGDGGRGGAGGRSGQPGSVHINNPLLQVKYIMEPGGAGDSGASGNIGRGGKNGTSYRGIYISEYVFPFFRRIGEFNCLNVRPFANGAAAGGAGAALPTLLQATPRLTYEAAKEALKAAWRASGREGGRAAYEAAKAFLKANKAASLSSTTLSVLGSTALISVQCIASSVSAHKSSYWKTPPHPINQGYAANGNAVNLVEETVLTPHPIVVPFVVEDVENQQVDLDPRLSEDVDTLQSTPLSEWKYIDNQHALLVSDGIEESDAVQSSIRETAIELKIPLEIEEN